MLGWRNLWNMIEKLGAILSCGKQSTKWSAFTCMAPCVLLSPVSKAELLQEGFFSHPLRVVLVMKKLEIEN